MLAAWPRQTGYYTKEFRYKKTSFPRAGDALAFFHCLFWFLPTLPSCPQADFPFFLADILLSVLGIRELTLIQGLVTLEAGHATAPRADMAVFADLKPQGVSRGRCLLIQTRALRESRPAGEQALPYVPTEVVTGACWVSPGAVVPTGLFLVPVSHG